MCSSISNELLLETCRDAACSVIRRSAGLLMQAGAGGPPEERAYSVFTNFDEALSCVLVFTAGEELFRRICQGMIRREEVAAQDVSDAAVEYFNVVCGSAVAGLYRATRIKSHFQIPKYCAGVYEPADLPRVWTLELTCEGEEHARLSCYRVSEDDTERGGENVKKRVMVVDDSHIMEVQLEVVLEGTDYEIVSYCCDGEEAIACYDEVKPDLVTMDILMPGMDGLETAKAILEQHPQARIIMLSSMAFDETFQESDAIGVKVFVAKPFDQAQIVAAFEEALHK